jgi:hypothetical protein
MAGRRLLIGFAPMLVSAGPASAAEVVEIKSFTPTGPTQLESLTAQNVRVTKSGRPCLSPR